MDMAKWLHVTAIAAWKIASWIILTMSRYGPNEMEGTYDRKPTRLLNTSRLLTPFWT